MAGAFFATDFAVVGLPEDADLAEDTDLPEDAALLGDAAFAGAVFVAVPLEPSVFAAGALTATFAGATFTAAAFAADFWVVSTVSARDSSAGDF